LSLLRSAVITAYSYSGGYEPGVSSDLGLELGEERGFDYALVPHNGDSRESQIYRAGLEFNNPLIARKTSRHAGPLPSHWGLVEITPPNVVASALKLGEDTGLILRVYEAAGKTTSGVKIKLPHGSRRASEVNLIEQPLRDAKVLGDSITFDLRPFEIKTFRIELPRAH
jgi:alpha-mannosidase